MSVKRLLGFLLALSLPLYAAGCGCTEAGCSGGIGFTVTGAATAYGDTFPLTFHLCAGATCADFDVAPGDGGSPICTPKDAKNVGFDGCSIDASGALTASVNLDDGGTVTTTIEVNDQNGTVLFQDSADVETTSVSPNGALCGPTCYGGTVTFAPASK